MKGGEHAQGTIVHAQPMEPASEKLYPVVHVKFGVIIHADSPKSDYLYGSEVDRNNVYNINIVLDKPYE